VTKSHVFFGTVICLMFMAVIVALFTLDPPPGAREPLLILVGSLGAAFGAVVAFAFGSSAGSQKKDLLLAQSAPMHSGPNQ
jgi:hypothetical protein